MPVEIREGVTWAIAGGRLSATVRAEFPQGFFGKAVEWVPVNLLDVVPKDRDHARRELEYLKALIEAEAGG